jgi:hypothetical protein
VNACIVRRLMRKLDRLDWLMFFAAAPLGAVAAAALGMLACVLMFKVTGTGTSHNDAFTLVAVTMLSGVVGVFVGPGLVWRRWRRQNPY